MAAFWKPGDPVPEIQSRTESRKLKGKGKEGTRKRKWNTHDNADESDNLVPLQKPPKTKAAKLSSNVKTLKFMQRQAERVRAQHEKREKERALREQRWVVDVSNAPDNRRGPFPKRIVVVRDTQKSAMGPMNRLSRRSFRGFNSVVEKHHIAIKKEEIALKAGLEAADGAIDDDEMAAVLGNHSKRGKKRLASERDAH